MVRTIAQLAEEFAQAVNWLRGHRVEPGQRILRYAETLDAAVAVGRDQLMPIPEDQYYSTVFEVSQLCDIARLPDRVLDSAEIRRKLAILGQGEEHYYAAGDNDQGRDIGFELSTAACFCSVGLDAHLDSPADVAVIRPDGRDFQIECKRPRRAASMRANLMRAYEQIDNHRHEAPDSIALVAVDLTRVLHPTFGPIRSRTMLDAANAFDIRLSLFEHENLQAYADAARNSRGADLVRGKLYKFQGMFHLADGSVIVGAMWRFAMTRAEQNSVTGQEIRRVFSPLIDDG